MQSRRSCISVSWRSTNWNLELCAYFEHEARSVFCWCCSFVYETPVISGMSVDDHHHFCCSVAPEKLHRLPDGIVHSRVNHIGSRHVLLAVAAQLNVEPVNLDRTQVRMLICYKPVGHLRRSRCCNMRMRADHEGNGQSESWTQTKPSR